MSCVIELKKGMVMSRYAENTSVSVAKSRAEVEETLERFGASSFGYMRGQENGYEKAIIAFCIESRNVRMSITLPDKEEEKFKKTPGGRRRRNNNAAHKAWEQECRRAWRALVYIIKAKLVAVQDGISTVEREFMADILMPDGHTIEEHVSSKIEQAYSSGKNVPLLPGGFK